MNEPVWKGCMYYILIMVAAFIMFKACDDGATSSRSYDYPEDYDPCDDDYCSCPGVWC